MIETCYTCYICKKRNKEHTITFSFSCGIIDYLICSRCKRRYYKLKFKINTEKMDTEKMNKEKSNYDKIFDLL